MNTSGIARPDSLPRLVRRALNDVIAAVLKRDDAPASSETHAHAAIVTLLELCPAWQPWDEESRKLVEYAKTHMALYRPPPAEELGHQFQLKGEHARYRDALQQIATSHPINPEPLATAHSLKAHKALRPDCTCTRCVPPNDPSSPTAVGGKEQ